MEMSNKLCLICEHNIPLYKNICTQCYIKGFDTLDKIVEIKPLEVFNFLNRITYNNLDKIQIRDCYKLQRNLLSKMQNQIKYNPIFETRCICGNIHEKNIDSDEPYEIKCDKCGLFCPYCSKESHLGISCKEYQKVLDDFYEYKSTIYPVLIDEIKETERIHANEEAELANLREIVKLDLRQCPYCDWDSAVKFESRKTDAGNSAMEESEMLTKQYTKKTWHKIACKSEPVIKTECDDIICGEHNPERIGQMKANGEKIGINKKGCGKRINWKYWKKITPTNAPKKKMTILKNLLVCLRLNLDIEKYTCYQCQKKKKIFCVSCRKYDCPYKGKKLCGDCIISNKNKISEIQITINNKIYSLIKTNPTQKNYEGIIFDLQTRKDVKVILIINKKDERICICKKEKNIRLKHDRIGTIKYGKQGKYKNITRLDNSEEGKCYKFFWDDNYYYSYSSDCKIINYSTCIKNHIMNVNNLSMLKEKIENIDEIHKQINAINLITSKYKSWTVSKKWFDTINILKVQLKASRIINKEIKSYLLKLNICKKYLQNFLDKGSNGRKYRILKNIIRDHL